MENHCLYHGTMPGSRDLDLPIMQYKRTMVPGPSSRIPERSLTAEELKLPPLKTKEECIAEMKSCHYCQVKKLGNTWDYPITIVNLVDNEELPDDFEFIHKSIISKNVEMADEDFVVGCECARDDECQRKTCTCLQDMSILQDNPWHRAKINAYESAGPYKDCLREDLTETRDPIYECGEKCICTWDCNNRTVYRGRTVPLEIFRTPDGRGWGVRTKADIRHGQYIDKYVGEILAPEEAERRREQSQVAKRKDVYLFALDKFSDPDSMDDRLAGPPYEVDGEFKSGATRFINHSCDPNLRNFAIVSDLANKHIHDLALFAIRDIEAGEELTFDYVDGVDTDPVLDAKDPDMRGDMTVCLCGSENCRGFLW